MMAKTNGDLASLSAEGPADSGDSHILPLGKAHATAAAALHRQGIHTGFQSSLGAGFLREIYRGISACRAGFGYVWLGSDGAVLGFIACAESTGRVYKQALLRRGAFMALPLARFLLRPSVLKRMIETLRYPAQAAEDLPTAEILSIAVAPQARGKGVGKALMQAAFEEFRRRRITHVRVAVGADNAPANAFYLRCGFRLAQQRTHHGLPMNIYVADVAN